MCERILSLFISMVYINISNSLYWSQFQMIWGVFDNMKIILRLLPVDNMIYVGCIVGISSWKTSKSSRLLSNFTAGMKLVRYNFFLESNVLMLLADVLPVLALRATLV